MQKLSRIVAAAAVFVWVPAGLLMAQNTPSTGPETATTPAPAPNAPAPAATAPAPAATAPAPAAPATTTTEHTTKKRNLRR